MYNLKLDLDLLNNLQTIFWPYRTMIIRKQNDLDPAVLINLVKIGPHRTLKLEIWTGPIKNCYYFIDLAVLINLVTCWNYLLVLRTQNAISLLFIYFLCFLLVLDFRDFVSVCCSCQFFYGQTLVVEFNFGKYQYKLHNKSTNNAAMRVHAGYFRHGFDNVLFPTQCPLPIIGWDISFC